MLPVSRTQQAAGNLVSYVAEHGCNAHVHFPNDLDNALPCFISGISIQWCITALRLMVSTRVPAIVANIDDGAVNTTSIKTYIGYMQSVWITYIG